LREYLNREWQPRPPSIALSSCGFRESPGSSTEKAKGDHHELLGKQQADGG